MNKPLKNRPPSNKSQEQGFTLIEVLAGIIISVTFVLITSQAIAISALYRVRAQRESEALLWIQEDFEDIKFASIQNLTATCNATDVDDGFAQALAANVTGDNTVTLPLVENSDDAAPSIGTPVLLNKTFRATRTLFAYGDEPFNILGISYSITDPESTAGSLNSEISTFYTEVIPDAAFDCD